MKILQGRYQLLDPIGEGGMGRVHLAQALHLHRSFAVKELKGPDPEDPEFAACLQAFQREARLLASLHHPRLPRVVDFFEEDGRHYLVMDYVAGVDLARLLAQGEAFPPERVARWGLALAETLEYLHGQTPPVIVYDLKPSNLIRTDRDELVLVDFGIARTLAPSGFTRAMGARGSPGYAPPEQYAAGPADPRSDLYALGATLYHLLTGQAPAESVQRAAGLARPAWETLPARLRPVLERAMALEPDARFQSARELREALELAMEEENPRVPDSASTTAQEPDSAFPTGRDSGSAFLTAQEPGGAFLTAARERFRGLGWRERSPADWDLCLEAPGLFSSLMLIRIFPGVLDETALEALAADLMPAALCLARARRTTFLVVAAGRIPNPQAVAHRSAGLSQIGLLRRLAVVPVDLGQRRVLDGFLPADLRGDNDRAGAILNLGAALGASSRA